MSKKFSGARVARRALTIALLAGMASACGGGGGGTASASSSASASATPAPSPTPTPVSSSTPTPQPAVATSASVSNASVATILRGINISGGEFAGGGAPGRLGVQYTYPTKAEIDYYSSLGFTVIRVPFMWERLQPSLYGALSEQDRALLREVVDYATGKGMVVVLDMHNYARRATGANYGTVSLIGSAQVPVDALTDGWARIAADYRSNARVWLGLMNEPYGISAGQWWPVAQQLVKDLRGRSINNTLLVPGTSWTGAHSWTSSGNAAAAEGFVDPINKSVFEVHQYLDADSSGKGPSCVTGSGARVAGVINWAKARGVKLFMGEMAASGEGGCGVEYRDMLNRMESSGVFAGWTAWGGGTWWVANYPFRTLTTAWPDTSQSTPHLKYLLEYLKNP